jgi:hypothetical protein
MLVRRLGMASAACLLAAACGGRGASDSSDAVAPDAAASDGGAAPIDVCSEQALSRVTMVASETTTDFGFSRIALDDEDVVISTGQSVKRVSKCGGEVVTLASTKANAFDLALHGESVYWTFPYSDDGEVLRLSKGGGEPDPLASGLPYPWGIAVDEREVFWSDIGRPSFPHREGGIYAVPLAGGQVRTVASGFHNCRSPQLDDQSVYCQSYTSSGSPIAIMKVDKHDGTIQALVEGEGAAELSLDGDVLYYVGGVSGQRLLRSVSTSGGEPTTLYVTANSVELGDLVGTSSGVYVLDVGIGAGAVRRVPLDGGPPETIAKSGTYEVGRNLAVDERSVYWVETHSECTRWRPAMGDVGQSCEETTTESRLMRAKR